MKMFLSTILAVLVMVAVNGCSDGLVNQKNEEVGNSSNPISESFEESVSPELLALANELKNDLYLLVGDYINGEITFKAASMEFSKLVSKYSDDVLDEVVEVGGIEIFFMLGEDNPNDELIVTLYEGLELYVTGVYKGGTSSTGNETTVSYEQEIILMMIAEDVAKQIAQNPSTVRFKTMYWGFEREGHSFWVQGTFECSNLLGVKENHTIQVLCIANSNYSKIQPEQVYLDGVRLN